MGFNPPVPQQDNNWEIRVAVLLSLLLQVLLIFLGPTRKRSTSLISRFIVWSCYLLADWVADLALGLILNNMGNIGVGGGNSTDSSSPIIFAFWTPFLLLHLGGPDTITAYSMEDNELWLRHLIGLLFELFSACVIFFCSLRGNPLIHATVLMFVVGIIKYGERTYSLYSASVERLRDSMVGSPVPGLDYAKLMRELDARKKAGEDVGISIDQEQEEDEEEFDIGQTSPISRELDELESMEEELQLNIESVQNLEVRAYELFLIFRRISVDVVVSLLQRMKSRDFFVRRRPNSSSLKPKEALEVVDVELGFMYEMLYTKAPIAHTCKGLVLRSICSCCLVSALVIFFLLDKPRHQVKRVDVGITYTLLLGGLALDAATLIMLLFSNRAIVFLEQQQSSAKCKRLLAWFARLSRAVRWRQHSSSWSGAASQMNLISYCRDSTTTDEKWWRWLMIAAKMLRMEEMVHDLVFIKHVKLSFRNKEEDPYGSTLLEFIFDGLKHTAQKVGDDKKSINEVCNRRGAGVLQYLFNERINDLDKQKVIMESVENRGLDESLLLWHIATDLCLLGDGSPPRARAGAGAGGTQVEDLWHMRAISKILSEYMLYLLIKQPDMLSVTTGIGLRPYRDTCAEARRFFADIDSNEDAQQALLRVNTSEKPQRVKGNRSKSVLFDGVILAKVLRELDEGFMWRLVLEFWWEMLMFSAVNSRGSTHVRSLNRGGELVTIVWLLMHHMGLSDMYEIQQQDPNPLLQWPAPPPPPRPVWVSSSPPPRLP